MKAKTIKNRFDSLVSQRKTLDDTLQIIERFVVPHRGEFFRPMMNEHEVDWRRREIFDQTAVNAAETLASSMQGSLTSPSIKWFKLAFRQDKLNKDHTAMKWIEKCENIVYQALLDSNFNLESAEFYLDLVSYGTAILTEEAESEDPNNWKGIDFQAAPMRDCYFEMDHKNNVKRFYRQYAWTPLQIIDKFGDKTPDDIKKQVTNNDSNNQRHAVIFCSYEREDKKHHIGSSAVLAPRERPYGWQWVLHKTGEQLGDEGGYYENLAFIARWRKTSGSQWGYSPAHICLSDILTLNELTEGTLESIGKVIDPVTITTARNMLSDIDLNRGGLVVVKDIDGIKPFESRARFDVGELRIDRLQQAINQAFRIDQLQMKESPAMTATEVNVRYELMQRLLGPTLGRLQADYLDPLINRTFKILSRAGQLPEMPSIVADFQGEMDVEYTGPLPRAQRQEAVQSANMWVANTAGLQEVAPETLDNIDFDELVRDTAKLSGIPAKYMRSTDDVKDIRENRAKQQQQMMDNENAKQEGEAMEAQGKGEKALSEVTSGQ